jgi:hypothetical protein
MMGMHTTVTVVRVSLTRCERGSDLEKRSLVILEYVAAVVSLVKGWSQ